MLLPNRNDGGGSSGLNLFGCLPGDALGPPAAPASPCRNGGTFGRSSPIVRGDAWAAGLDSSFRSSASLTWDRIDFVGRDMFAGKVMLRCCRSPPPQPAAAPPEPGSSDGHKLRRPSGF